MITPRITCCKECPDIVPLIEEIDCRLSKLSVSAYNNIIYALNSPINQGEAISLLFYKRILQYKFVNPDYAGAFSTEMIASQIKKYTVGCEKDCTCEELMKSFGTTTSTSTSTTSTSTTLVPTTTTTLPPTTTTTTTGSVSYIYGIALYDCYCNFIDFSGLSNAYSLTPDKYYYNFINNTIVKIVSLNGVFPGLPDAYIVDSNKKNTCSAVIGCQTTTSTSSTTSTTTINPSIFRVIADCCGSSVERVANVPGLVGQPIQAAFTGTDGWGYVRVSLTPTALPINFAQSGTDTTIYSSCAMWSTAHPLGCPTTTTTSTTAALTTTTTSTTPTTTTTTTAIPCVSYTYGISTFTCSACAASGSEFLDNSEPLTLNKFYYDAVSGLKVLVLTDLGCGDIVINHILNSSQQPNCPSIICPSTTTSTTANPYPFSFQISTGDTSPTIACTQTPITTNVKSNCNGLSINIGCTIVNFLSNLPFNGNNRWFTISSGSGIIQIGGTGPNLGKVIGKTTCP